jgi:hypothetical protein
MLTAVYDLAVSPPTFDFVSFLVSAERERLRQGKAHIRVLIAAGPDHGFRRDELPPRDPAERRRMLDNIVLPMCGLLPSVVAVEEWEAHEIKACDFPAEWTPRTRMNNCYSTDLMVQAWKKRCFPLTAGVTEHTDEITITLRESEYWPSRNSNVPAWMELAGELRARGENVRVIHHNDFPHVRDRAQVYERAKLNLFVNNGPAAFAYFMPRARCLVFKMVTEGVPCAGAKFFAGIGFPVGSQIGREGCRIVWEDDDAETIARETIRELEEYEHG